jgi:hypothetical protein
MTSLSIQFRTALVVALLGSGLTAFAQDLDYGIPSTVTRVLVDASGVTPQQQIAALSTEQQMMARAAKIAAAGELKRAWKALTADVAKNTGKGNDGISADRLGWRVATVVGFLKNQSEGEIADTFARYALGESWCQQSPSDEVRYWCAVLAVDGMGDRKSAKAWLGSAKSGEAARIKAFRDKLDNAEKAFDGRG